MTIAADPGVVWLRDECDERRGDRRIHGVAAVGEHRESRLDNVRVARRDHPLPRADLASGGRDRPGALRHSHLTLADYLW
jgi:hypothetical protein